MERGSRHLTSMPATGWSTCSRTSSTPSFPTRPSQRLSPLIPGEFRDKWTHQEMYFYHNLDTWRECCCGQSQSMQWGCQCQFCAGKILLCPLYDCWLNTKCSWFFPFSGIPNCWLQLQQLAWLTTLPLLFLDGVLKLYPEWFSGFPHCLQQLKLLA